MAWKPWARRAERICSLWSWPKALDVMERHKMVVENAGLLTVAALRHLGYEGRNVVSVLSGGNMDAKVRSLKGWT